MGIDLNQDWQGLLNQLTREPYFWGIVVGVLVLVYTIRQIRTRSDIQLFDNDGGIVTVSHTALVSLVRKTCIEACPNSSPKIKIFFKKGDLHIQIKLKAPSSQNIQALSTRIQSQVQTVFSEDLNFDRLGSINILLSGFTADKGASKHSENANPSDISQEN